MLVQYLKAFAITLLCFSVGILSGVVVADESQLDVVDPYDGFYTFSLNLHRFKMSTSLKSDQRLDLQRHRWNDECTG